MKKRTEKLSRRSFMAASGVAALGVASVGRAAAGHPASAQPASKGRSIVFVLLDDLRYDGFGLANPFFETPAIDALAKGGVIFERAFVTTSLCSPSRACTLSGQYAHRHGVLDNNTALPPDTPTFPRELQKAGYRTGYIGKWHMGGDSDEPRPGFDRWVSFRGQGVYRNPTFNIDGEKVKRDGHVTDLITDYAEEFIRRDDARPFCLYVGHKAVHAMFEPAERHKGSYANKTWPRPASMADTEENYRGKPAWVCAQRNSWHGVDGMQTRAKVAISPVETPRQTRTQTDKHGRAGGCVRSCPCQSVFVRVCPCLSVKTRFILPPPSVSGVCVGIVGRLRRAWRSRAGF
jgi:hypothetical protein